MQDVSRCPECEEPKFMCACAQNFQGEIVKEIYHHANHRNGLETYHLPLRPTIVINRRALLVRSPFRHEWQSKYVGAALILKQITGG